MRRVPAELNLEEKDCSSILDALTAAGRERGLFKSNTAISADVCIKSNTPMQKIYSYAGKAEF